MCKLAPTKQRKSHPRFWSFADPRRWLSSSISITNAIFQSSHIYFLKRLSPLAHRTGGKRTDIKTGMKRVIELNPVLLVPAIPLATTALPSQAVQQQRATSILTAAHSYFGCRCHVILLRDPLTSIFLHVIPFLQSFRPFLLVGSHSPLLNLDRILVHIPS